MNFLLNAIWTIIVPQLTWVVLYIVFTVSPQHRLAVVSLWAIISLFTNKTTRIGHKILKTVAAARGLDVIRSDTSQVKQKKPAIYAFHPHGRYPLDIYLYLASDDDLSMVSLANASSGKYFPTIAVVMSLYGNTIDASRTELLKGLVRNKHIGIFPGGAREMHECKANEGDTLRIAQHDGFLRIARATGAEVVPCFLFGMENSYISPFVGLQKKVYSYTKLSFPIWFPAMHSIWPRKSTSHTMVVGKPIRTTMFNDDDALIKKYWSELGHLFEKHKSNYPEYASRKLTIVPHQGEVKMRMGMDYRTTISGLKTYQATKYESTSGPKSLSPMLLSMLRFASFMNIFFIIGTFGYFLFYRQWWRTSSWTALEEAPEHLLLHFVSATVWTIVSTLNLFKHQSMREHRITGYIGVLSTIGMFATGISMSLEVIKNTQSRLAKENIEPSWSWWGDDEANLWTNTFIQSISIFQVACMSFYLVASSIRAARAHQIRRHKELMSQIHLLLTDMVTPRIMAIFLRFLLPNIGRSSIVTIASILQWIRHITVLSTRVQHLLLHNIIAFVLSLIMMMHSTNEIIVWVCVSTMVVIALVERPPIKREQAKDEAKRYQMKRTTLLRKFKRT